MARNYWNTNTKRCQHLYIIISCIVFVQIYIEYTLFSLNQSELYKVQDLVKMKLDKYNNKSANDDKINKRQTKYEETRGRTIKGLSKEETEFPSKQKKSASDETQPMFPNKIRDRFSLLKDRLERARKQNKFQSKCEIKSKEAISAINRSRSIECKQKIADIVCQNQSKYLFEEKLPRFCPLKGVHKGMYMGCFNDSFEQRLLGNAVAVYENDNSVEKCINTCLGAGLNYAGLQFTRECWCGNSLEVAVSVPEERCNLSCPGKLHQRCGGLLAMNIYQTGYGESPDPKAPFIHSYKSSEPSVKIVFVMLLSGRGVRQVKQLFQMIYSPDHYYYIHVDLRCDYLFRELLPLQDRFSNVYITHRRLITLWSGPSLLTAQLNCMEELLKMRQWKWDYFVNLSESHFPLRPLDELVNYLTMYKGMNFVIGTGIKGQQLVDTSAYDAMFVECDDYVWNIGSRQFPWGIAWDSGSDWYMLHYNFVEYVTTSKDHLVEPLKVYFSYSLSAAEELTKDSEFKYFARKFDAMVSQMIMTDLERKIKGEHVSDDVEFHRDSYWLNIFHHLDNELIKDDAYTTYYHSFTRRAFQAINKECQITQSLTYQFLQMHVFTHSDITQGLVLQTEVKSPTNVHLVETYIQPLKYFKKYNGSMVAESLRHMHVGTKWDKKEEIFRNYGNLMGPFSQFTLALHWKDGAAGFNGTVNAVYVDPRKKVVGVFPLIVKDVDRITTHTPNFKGPLVPGTWNVQLFLNGSWNIVAQTIFMIIPLSHYKGHPISADDAKTVHMGGDYIKNMSNNFHFNGLNVTEFEEKVGINAKKTGNDLLQWIDNESTVSFSVRHVCVSKTTTHFVENCGILSVCENTYWSSLSPDLKSDLSTLYPSDDI